MRPISSFLLDQEVTLTLNTWGTDVDGSRVVASTVIKPEIPAAVLPGKPQRQYHIEPETGIRRMTEWTPVTVQFDGNVGLHLEDLIDWTDESDVDHTYLVHGYSPLAGQPGAWVATCEERA